MFLLAPTVQYLYTIYNTYSVMQSDGMDFVLNSFNMVYRDKKSILDQKFKSKSFGIFNLKT